MAEGFNPRTPCGVRPSSLTNTWTHSSFQSTHSLRSATIEASAYMPMSPVSIHALLAECDERTLKALIPHDCFNPRTPCGVRQLLLGKVHCGMVFQSTHSLRSATIQFGGGHIQKSRFNPRTPCGVRPVVSEELNWGIVSIHALLAECDSCAVLKIAGSRCFNPRTPCGVRRGIGPGAVVRVMFQSTHSLRSATWTRRPWPRIFPVSIHALLAECDFGTQGNRPLSGGFNPRTPCGVRPGRHEY